MAGARTDLIDVRHSCFIRRRLGIPGDERWRFILNRGGVCALMLVLFAGGCASKRDQVAQALGSGARAPVVREVSVEEAYRLAYPDAVEIHVEGRHDCSGRFPISVEGRIAVPRLDNPRIDGGTIGDLQRQIAHQLGLPAARVHCRVIGHGSRVIYVRGPIEGGDRAVPYQGPESVVGLIRRCGGLHSTANLNDIHVVRSNVPLGMKPQVFAVDLEAILLRGEPQTNVLLQSFDEVCIGEMPRAKLGKALPEWLRPVYRAVCSLLPWLCPQDWRQQIGDPDP